MSSSVSEIPPSNVLVVGGESKIAKLLRTKHSDLRDINLYFQSRNKAYPADIYWDPLGASNVIEYKHDNLPPKFDLLLNLAGTTQSGNSYLNTELALKCCSLAERLQIPKVFLASSAAVYGNQQIRYSENDHCSPVNSYGLSKLAMEDACLSQDFPFNILCLRISNFLGADALSNSILSGKNISLDVRDSKLSGLRSYLAPKTFLKILRSLSIDNTLKNQPINIANPSPYYMHELLEELGIIYHVNYTKHDIFDIALDITLLKSVHEFAPNDYQLSHMLNQLKWN